jgi:hypothetical protein
MFVRDFFSVFGRNKIGILLFALTAFQSAQGAVWTTTQQWNADKEAEFQQWVNQNWDKNYFTRPGPFQNVKMDCADAVYAMRLVYASQKGLPFVMKDPTGGGGVISNDMKRWDHMSENDRKRAFLLYVFYVGSTASLPNDTFPTAVNRQAITSGSMILTDSKSHHTWSVRYISRTGIPFLIFSSRPARTVFFERFEYPSMEFTFPNGLKPERHAGFRYFRQPQDIQKPVWQVSGYSTEQYEIPYKSWHRTLQTRLQLQEETPEEKVVRILGDACRAAGERVEIVNQGHDLNTKLGSKCMNSTQYDDYSTPSRDARLQSTFQELATAYREATGKMSAQVLQKVESVVLGHQAPKDQPYCAQTIAPGVVLTLGEIFERSISGKLSNNPQDPVLARWGLQAHPSSKAKSCPVY